MASPDPGLKDGFSLPAWMKTKPTREFEPFGSSPPPLEDSFFLIKYPKAEAVFGKPGPERGAELAPGLAPALTPALAPALARDWSTHTRPCQEVLHSVPPGVAEVSTVSKRTGGDDKKDDGAACGSSVVQVANKMISSRTQRGFAVAEPGDDGDALGAGYRSARRGSKSLPVTPLHSPPGSPGSRRRRNGNKYFTSPFEPVMDGAGRSWLTAALLGFKKDLTASTSTLAEEDALDARLQGVSLAESVENLGPAPRRDFAADPSPPQPKPAPALRPKPSELREMNFWSPTSM